MTNVLIDTDMLLENAHYLNKDDYDDLYDQSAEVYFKQHNHQPSEDEIDNFSSKNNVYFVSNHSLLENALETYYKDVSKKTHSDLNALGLMKKHISGFKWISTDLNGNGFAEEGFLFTVPMDEGKAFYQLTSLVPNGQKFMKWVNTHVGSVKA